MIGGRDLWQNPESDPDVPQGGIPCGAAIEYSTEWECIEKVRKAVEIGCESVRIKIKPGCDASLVNAIRKEHPRLNLVLDGNQAYTETSLKSVFDLEGYNISCIIDPLDPSAPPKVGPQGIWERLSRLQRDLGASICVERCWNGLDDHHFVNERSTVSRVCRWSVYLKVAYRAYISGALAQLGERGLCKPEVKCSIPLCSTKSSLAGLSG